MTKPLKCKVGAHQSSRIRNICYHFQSSLRYPYKYGRQRAVLRGTQPTGLSLDYTLLPGHLQESGYTTRLVGKWHLGFCHPAYLPTNRGFHSHYGYWNAEEDYYSKRALDWSSLWGYDFHDDLEITREPAGKAFWILI